MNVEQCLKEGLLARSAPDYAKARNSLRSAEHKRSLAQAEFKAGIYEGAVISAYSAMFHAARALLFKDGFTERSHYATYVFLVERYSKEIRKPLLDAFSALRLQRHELQYGFVDGDSLPDREKAKDVLDSASDFIDAICKQV